MSTDARFIVLTTLLVAIVGGLASVIIYMIKGAARWGRTEQQMENLVARVDKLVTNKDEVHREMMTTIREDRAATDKRLRWLEETLWTTKATMREGGRGRPT